MKLSSVLLSSVLLVLLNQTNDFEWFVRQMVVRSLHEIVQQVIDSEDDVSRALSAAERFSHDYGWCVCGCLSVCVSVCLCVCVSVGVLLFSCLQCDSTRAQYMLQQVCVSITHCYHVRKDHSLLIGLQWELVVFALVVLGFGLAQQILFLGRAS